MAKHKAPTEVTVALHEEKSGLATFVEKHWVKGAIVAVMVSGFILYQQWQSRQAAEVVDASWTRLMSAVEESGGGELIGDPDLIDGLSSELEGTIAAPWALFLKARGLREQGEYDAAVAVLLEIKERYPEHPLVRDKRTRGDSATPLSAIEHLSKVFNAEAEWRSTQPQLFDNPAPPPGSPTVTIQTDYGDIVVALYQDLAPKHSENLIQLAQDGFYNGIKIHRTAFGQMLETGDPLTKEEGSDPLEWGKQGIEHSVETEETGLFHFAGYLSMNKLATDEGSNGSLFAITVQDVHYRNDQNVVFGKVVEGLEVAQEIAALPADPSGQRPSDPVVIQSMTVTPGA